MAKKTVRRDWLRRRVQKGLAIAKVKYHYTDDYAGDAAYNFGKTHWLRARYAEDNGDFVEGIINFHSWDFTGQGGSAWRNEDDTITLYKGYESTALYIVEDDDFDGAIQRLNQADIERTAKMAERRRR